MKELINIQCELKAPKNQYNNFSKYKYRNCEDILEAVKPLLEKYNIVLNISDEIIQMGNRFYVKSTAKVIKTTEDKETFIASYGFAREEDIKKGMDSAQITGAASSYARKYALNGLFCIDDTKDSDTPNKFKPKPIPKPKDMTKYKEIYKKVETLSKKTGKDIPQLVKEATNNKYDNINDLEEKWLDKFSEKLDDLETVNSKIGVI